MPVLPGVGQTDGPAVLHDVREDPHLRNPGLVIPGEHGLDPAEALREVPERGGLEPLIREAQHAVTAEGQEDRREVASPSGLAEIHAPHGRSQDLAGRFYRRHVALPTAHSTAVPKRSYGHSMTSLGSV